MQSCGTYVSLPPPHARSRGPARSLHPWLALAAAAGALGITGCRDLPPAPNVASPPTLSLAPAALVGDPESDSWNRFEVDVDVAIDGPTAPLMVSRSSRGMSYRIIRHLEAQGGWATDLEMGEYRPRTTSRAPVAAPPPIARISGISRTGTPQFLDAAGRRITQTQLTLAEPVAAGRVHPRTEAGTELRRFAPPATRPELAAADTSRAWVAQYVTTRKTAEELRAVLERGANRVETARGRTTFSRTQGGRSSEVIIEDATGVIVGLRATEGDRLQSVTEREWERGGGGALILKSERLTQFPAGDGTRPLVVTTTYRNMRFVEAR